MFIKSLITLPLVGITLLPVTAQDLRSFSKWADDLSQQVQACYKNEVGRDNGKRKQKEAISRKPRGQFLGGTKRVIQHGHGRPKGAEKLNGR